MKSYYADNTMRIDYNPINHKTAFLKHDIGPSVYVAISVDAGTPTNLNRIFVDSVAGNDSTGTGTSTAPYKTLVKSANSCTATQQYVHVLDDAAVFIEDLSAIDNEYFQGIFCATGQTASMWKVAYGFVPADANSIFVTKAGNDTTGTGSLAAPVLTIAKAITLCDATHQAVVIVPAAAGEVYTESPFEFTGNFLALYGWNTGGYTATVKFTQTAASITTTSSEHTFAAVNCRDAYGDHASCVLTNGNIVLCYVDEEDGCKGRFIIKNTSGNTIAGPTQFNTGLNVSTSNIAVALLNSGGFITCYRDDDGGGFGAFTTWTSSGLADKAQTIFNNANTSDISCCVLPVSGYVVIAWRDYGDSSKGKFRIYDPSDWSDVKTETEFESGATEYISLCPMSNDNFIIFYSDSGDASTGKFKIVDQTGADVLTTTSISDTALFCNSSITDDDEIILFYRDTNTDGNFIIYDSSGNILVSKTKFYTASLSGINFISSCCLINNHVVVSYADVDDGNKGKFSIYDTTDGTCLLSDTIFHDGATALMSIKSFDDNTFYVAYIDDADSDNGKFIYYTLAGWSPVTVSAATTLIGLTFDADDSSLMYRMFNGTAKITAKYCEFMGVNNDTYLTQSHAIYSTAEVDIQNCKIHDNGCGIYSEENTSTIKNNLFYWNEKAAACYIKGTAAAPDDIIVEHNTFFENETGLELEDNGGTNETVKNNIFHGNYNYGIYAETAMSHTYSICTDTNNNVTAGSGIIGANPLFINEGAYTPTDINLKIKLRVLNYPVDSPAYELADDTTPDRDAGAWDIIPIGAETTWSTWTFEKPGDGIKPRQEPVDATFIVRKDGSTSSSVDAWVEFLDIGFTGMLIADYAIYMSMLTCGNSEVRVWGSPTTNPSDYDVFNIKYDVANQSSTHYENTKTGYSNNTLKFGRGYE